MSDYIEGIAAALGLAEFAKKITRHVLRFIHGPLAPVV